MSDSKRRSRRWLYAPILMAVLLAVPLLLWLMRGVIATSIARQELAAHDVECDDRFEVEVAAFFGSASVGPTRCTREGGLVEAIELTGDATVELSGFAPESLRAEGVRLTLRDRDVRNGSGWARDLSRLNLEQRVAGLVKGLAELSDMGLPPTTIASVDVRRGGDRMAAIRQIVLTPGAPTAVAMERVTFDVVMGAARLSLEGVSGTASRSTVHLEGQAMARAAIALFGSFSRGGAFTLDATRLDESEPAFRLRGSF